tara:strand:- start:4590 stop:21956 length:17367 start_codon:yes stop_codon:yes gene_type:complete
MGVEVKLDANNQPEKVSKNTVEEIKVPAPRITAEATNDTPPPSDPVTTDKVKKEAPVKPLVSTASVANNMFNTREFKANSAVTTIHREGLDLKETVGSIGDFNITDTDVQKKYINSLEKGAYDAAMATYQNQGIGSKVGGFLAQAAVGEIVLGTLEAAGYLVDMQQWIPRLLGEETEEVGNFFSDLMVEAKGAVREAAPIHMNPYKEGEMDPGSLSWWLSNGVSVASTLSILIPVAGWARGAALLGKATKIASTTVKATKLGGKLSKGKGKLTAGLWQVTGAKKRFNWVDELVKEKGINTKAFGAVKDAVHKGIISRHIEGMMEASGVYRDKKAELLDMKGENGSPLYTEEAAGIMASKGASLTYAADWVMLLQDIGQYAALGRTKGFIKAAKDPKLVAAVASATGQTIPNQFLKKLAYGTSSYSKQMAGEGFEEMYQYMAAEEGSHYVDVLSGHSDKSNFSSRVGDYMQDSEMWTSALFGALGGGVFQALGPSVSALAGKVMGKTETRFTEEQARVNAIIKRQEILKSLDVRLAEAAEMDNDSAVEIVQQDVAFELAVNGALNGNMQIDLDAFDSFAAMTPEEAQKHGIGPEAKQKLEFFKESYLKAAEILKKNGTEFAPNTVAGISHSEFMIDVLASKIPGIREKTREAIEKLGILHALSTDGKALVQSAVDIAGGRRAVKGMQQRIKVDKNLSKEEVADMKAKIITVEAALDAQTTVLNNTIAESTTLNAVDKVALKENSQYIKTLEGHSAELYHVNNSIERHMKNITRLTSEKGQEAAAKTLRDQINASIAHLDAEEAKKKEERTTRGGAKPGGLSGFQLEKAITEGAIEESKLNVDEKTRLENHRNGLPDDSSLNEETGEVSPVITIKNVAEKVSEGTELSEEEYTFWEENEEAIDALSTVIDGNPESSTEGVETIPTAEEGTGPKNVAKAITHDVAETPENTPPKTERIGGEFVVRAETVVIGKMVPKLAWASTSNNRTPVDPGEEGELTKHDKERAALTEFLEGDQSMEGIYFVIEIDTESDAWGQKANKSWKRKKKDFEAGKLPDDHGKIPMKAVMYRDGKPLEHHGEALYMFIHDDNFAGGSAELNEARALETLALKEKAIKAIQKGENLRLDFDIKTRGNLKIATNEDGSWINSNPDDVIVGASDSDWVYGHNSYYLDRVDGKGSPNGGLSAFSGSTDGGIYISTKGANGTSFPLRLSVDNISPSEANLAFALLKEVATNNAYTSDVSKEVLKKMKESKDPRISELYRVMKLDTEAITNSELLNMIVFAGKSATQGKGSSQLWVDKGILHIGDKTYSIAALGTKEAQVEITTHLIEFRKRQVNVEMLSNKEYKQYLMATGVVTTNAAITPTKRPFIQPSITYKNPITASSKPAAASSNNQFRDNQVILKEETFTLTDEDGGKQVITIQTNLDGSLNPAEVENFDVDGNSLGRGKRIKLGDNSIIVRDGLTAEQLAESTFAGDGYVMRKTGERSGTEVNNLKKIAGLTLDQKKKLGIKPTQQTSEVSLTETTDSDKPKGKQGNIGLAYEVVQNEKVVGEIVLNEFQENVISIAWSEMKKKGEGIGTKAYISLHNLLQAKGKKLVSDASRSPEAEALWKSFERKGLAKKVYIGAAKVNKKGSLRVNTPKGSDFVYEFVGETQQTTEVEKAEIAKLEGRRKEELKDFKVGSTLNLYGSTGVLEDTAVIIKDNGTTWRLKYTSDGHEMNTGKTTDQGMNSGEKTHGVRYTVLSNEAGINDKYDKLIAEVKGKTAQQTSEVEAKKAKALERRVNNKKQELSDLEEIASYGETYEEALESLIQKTEELNKSLSERLKEQAKIQSSTKEGKEEYEQHKKELAKVNEANNNPANKNLNSIETYFYQKLEENIESIEEFKETERLNKLIGQINDIYAAASSYDSKVSEDVKEISNELAALQPTTQTSEVDIFLKKESLAKAPAFAQKAIAKTVEAIPEDVRLKVIKKAYEGVTATFIANSLNLTTEQVRSIRTYYGAPDIADKKEYKKWKDGITAELAALKPAQQTSKADNQSAIDPITVAEQAEIDAIITNEEGSLFFPSAKGYAFDLAYDNKEDLIAHIKEKYAIIRAAAPKAPVTTSVSASNVSTSTKGTKVKYKPKGSKLPAQEYNVAGKKITNSKGVEVYATDSVDRNKIFIEDALANGRAEKIVLTSKNKNTGNTTTKTYYINKKGKVLSEVSGKEIVHKAIIAAVIEKATIYSSPLPAAKIINSEKKTALKAKRDKDLNNVKDIVTTTGGNESAERDAMGVFAQATDIDDFKQYIEELGIDEMQEIIEKRLTGYHLTDFEAIRENSVRKTLEEIRDGSTQSITTTVKNTAEIDRINEQYRKELAALGPAPAFTEVKDQTLPVEEEGATTTYIPDTSLPVAEDSTELTGEAKIKADLAKSKGEHGASASDSGLFSIGKETEGNDYASSEAEHLKSLLPDDVAIELVDGYVKILEGGWSAVGLFQHGMVRLSKKAPKGTGYHEAFHAVYRTMTTADERIQLQKDARRIFPLASQKQLAALASQHPDMSKEDIADLYYEEQMADEFGSYMYGTSTQVLPKQFPKGIKGFFNKLFSWINNVFSNPRTVNSIFQDIKMGKYKNSPVNVTRKVVFKAHRNYQSADVLEITRSLASFAMRDVDVIEDIENIDFANIKTSLSQAIGHYNSIQEDILTRIDATNPDDQRQLEYLRGKIEDAAETASRLTRLYDEIYKENDMFFIEKVRDYLSEFGISPKKLAIDGKTKEEKEDEDSELDEETGGNSLLKLSSYEVSGKSTATANIKLLIALTNKVVYDDQGDIVNERTGYLKLPTKADFSQLWNKLEQNLHGIIGHYDAGTGEYIDPYTLMIGKLSLMTSKHPELAQIVTNLEKSSEIIQTQFVVKFSAVKGDYIDHLISGTGSAPISKITSADNFAKEAMLISKWSDKFVKIYRTTNPTTKEPIYDTEKIKAIGQLIAASKKATAEFNRASLTTSFASEKATAIKARRVLLNSLGIYMHPQAIAKVIESFPGDGSGSEATYQATQMAKFDYRLDVALTGIKALSGPIDFDSSPLEDETFVKALAEAEAEFTHVMGENMKIIAGGKKAWIFQNNNSVTKAIQRIKNNDTTFIDALLATPNGTNSVWANALSNNPKLREELATGLYGNYRDQDSADKGDKAGDLKTPDQFNDVLNKYLNGFKSKSGTGLYVGLAEADKGQQWYIRGPKVIKSKVIGDNKGSMIVVDPGSLPVEILAGYLADELNRWHAAYEQRYGENKIAEDKQLLYYHYNERVNKETGETERTEGNAMGSYLFPNLDFKALGLMGGERPNKITKEELFKNKNVAAALAEILKERVTEDIASSLKYGVIKKDAKTGALANVSIDKDVLHGEAIQGTDEGSRIVNAVANYTVNSIIANVENTKMFTGDPALYKKGKGDGFEDFRKRIPMATSSGRDARVFKNPDGTWAVRRKYSSATTKDVNNMPSTALNTKDNEDGKPNENVSLIAEATGIDVNTVKEVLSPYNEVNRTDAQAWISLYAYKERMRAFGKWTGKHDIAYDNVMAGKLLPDEVKLLAMPLKTVHSGLELLPGGIMSMQINKQSEAPLIPGIHDETPLKALMDSMKKNKVDHVIVLDGKKAGAIGTTDMTNGNHQPGTAIELNPIDLDYSNLYLQQDLSTKGVKNTLVGTQMTKNLMGIVYPERIYGEGVDGIALLEDFNSTISKLSNIGLKEYQKKIGFNPDTGELDQKKFREALARELKDEFSDNVIDAILGGAALDSLPINIESRLTSMITKEAVKLKQSGGAFVQMSDFGIMGAEVNLNGPVKDGIIFFGDPTKELQPMTLTKDNDGKIAAKRAQILIPHGPILKQLQKAIDKKYGKGTHYKDLSHKEINSLIDKKALAGLIYRIPNQAPGSNDAIEIAGILPPEMGDTIIAYSEITTKTGSDFDIDKAFAIFPNLKFDSVTGLVTTISVNNTSKEGLQNRRADLMSQMLLHPEAYLQVMAPIDSEWLKEMAYELHPAETKKKDLKFFTATDQLEAKARFDNAKSLVGVIADQSSNYMLTLNEVIAFEGVNLGVGVTNSYGYSVISTRTDEENNQISETLGAFMNAIVDAAKDPFITRANINQTTAGVAFMLARTGASREFIMAFMGSPVLKKYVEMSQLSEGRISQPERDPLTGKKLTVLDKMVRDLDNAGVYTSGAHFKSNAISGSFLNHLSPPAGLAPINQNIDVTAAQLRELIEDPTASLVGQERSESDLDILAQFIRWQESAKKLNTFIRVTKADVNGASRSLVAAGIAERAMTDMILDNSFTNLASFLGYDIVGISNQANEDLDSSPQQPNLTPAFTGNVSQEMFGENDVMVFGANSIGGHGQGVAALAYANTTDNYRKWNPNLVSDIESKVVGDFAIAGEVGLTTGTKGTGYGIVTKNASIQNGRLKIGSPLDYVELGSQVEDLYETARKNPTKTFIIPYNSDNNLNKSSLNQLANTFGGRQIPSNVVFGDKMLAEIKRIKGTKIFESQQLNEVKLEATDRVVFGHPTIGKSYLKDSGRNDFISLDDDYSSEINAEVEAISKKHKVTTSQVKDGGKEAWNKAYNAKMQALFNIAKAKATKEGKTLFTSNTNLLKTNSGAFDKVINLSDVEFGKRIAERGAKYDTKEWKQQINEAISTIPDSKVINTEGYLSDLLPKQPNEVKEGVSEVFKENSELSSIGTEQEYSDYLDSVFPDSEVNDIVYHGSKNKFDTFDKSKLGSNTNPTKEFPQFNDSYLGFHFTSNPEYYKNRHEFGTKHEQNLNEYSVLLNIKNPKDIADKDPFSQNDISYINPEDVKDNDSIIHDYLDKVDFSKGEKTNIYTNNYVVFEPEQIHILGSKKDIEGFKEFVGSQSQPGTLINQTSKPSQSSKPVKEKDLSFKKGNLETFTLFNGKEVKGTAIIIEGQPNVDLFSYYAKGAGWAIIDNKGKSIFPLSSFFGGFDGAKKEILEALYSDIVRYQDNPASKKVLENIGFNFGDSVVDRKVKEVADGVKIIGNALTSSEEAEIFQIIKPFLESQGSRSNKGKNAPIMIGMGLRWDYKSNNPGKTPVEIKETIVNSQGQRNKYAYYDVAIDGTALGAIPPRLKELMTKATGVDASNYDGAIINIYQENGFISAHADVDESVTAINYPVIVANIGGAGSLSIEGVNSQKDKRGYASKEYIDEALSSGSAYIFGEEGKNRDVYHRTLPSRGRGNLPKLTIRGQTIPANAYRISVTLRRVRDLEFGMPDAPTTLSQPAQQASEVELPKVSKEIPFSYGNNKELILNGDKTITSRNFKFIPNLSLGESGVQTVDGVDFKVTYHGELKYSEVKAKTGVEYSEGEAFAKTTKGAPTEKATVDFISGKGTKHIYQFSKIQPTQQPSKTAEPTDADYREILDGVEQAGAISWGSSKIIGTYFKNSVLAVREVFKGQLLSETKAAESAMLSIASKQGLKIDSTSRGEALAETLMAGLRSGVNDFEGSPYHLTQLQKKVLIIGDDTQEGIADRVLTAQKDPALERNTLIQSMGVSGGIYKTPLISSKNLSKDAKDALYLDWLALKDYTADPTLFSDLIHTAYYTSGMQRNFGVFYEHIPTDLLMDRGYIEFWNKTMHMMEDGGALSEMEDKVIRHLWRKNDIVPVVQAADMGNIGEGVDPSMVFMSKPSRSPNLIAGKDAQGLIQFKKFVKTATLGQAEGHLYELVGYLGEGKKRIAIYKNTAKMGYNHKGSKIYEYAVESGKTQYKANKALAPGGEFQAAAENFLGRAFHPVKPVFDPKSETINVADNNLAKLTLTEKEELADKANTCDIS